MGECFLCDGSGIYKKPKNQEEFDRIFDKYDAPGFYNMVECRKKALDEVGYTNETCPKCNGTGKVE